MARLDAFLRLVAEQKASDLHFHSGAPPTIRFDGDLLPLPFRTLSDVETKRFLDEILTAEQKEILSVQGQVDVLYSLPQIGRFRGSIFTQVQGWSAVFRVIPGSIPTLDDLGLPPSIERLARLQNGLVRVTGPTGSAKSTTLAARVRQINQTSPRHIITVQAPLHNWHEPGPSRTTPPQVVQDVQAWLLQPTQGANLEEIAAGNAVTGMRRTPVYDLQHGGRNSWLGKELGCEAWTRPRQGGSSISGVGGSREMQARWIVYVLLNK